MNARWICAVAIASSWFASVAQAQSHADRGAVLGGVGGALAGAAIGKHNGETAGGALIGGAVGLLSGALIGNSMDAQESRQRYIEQQYIAQNARAVTISEVLNMTKNGVSDAVIINHINQQGVQQRLEVSDVILLHREGVSERVLTALQRARVGGSPVYVAPTRVYTEPVIVHDYHYVRPAYPVYVPRYYHPHHYHHGYHHSPGMSFGISVAH